MHIYIPTYRRPFTQPTYDALPQRWKDRVTFVVHPSEMNHFTGKDFVVCNKIGCSEFRQEMLEDAVRKDIGIVWTFDDDLKFSRRVQDWSPENPKLEPMTPEMLGEALDECESVLESGAYALVGFAPRGFNNGIPHHPTRKNTRVMRAYGFNVGVLTQEGLRFDKYRYCQDFHLTLSLLTRGYENLVFTKFCNDAPMNAKGGVSEYRTYESMLQNRTEFLKEWGAYATPVDKDASSWSVSQAQVMPDLKIDWAKAWRNRK